MKISIPDPCSVPITDMKPVEGGFYCDSCALKVTDFRDWSETDIKQYFLKEAGKKSCGIFKKKQVEETKAIIIIPEVEGFNLSFRQQFLYALLICFSSLFFSCGNEPATGKLTIENPYLDSLYNRNGTLAIPKTDSLKTMEGESIFIENAVGAYEIPIMEEITAGAPEVEIIEAPEMPKSATCDTIVKIDKDKPIKEDESFLMGVSISQKPEFPGGDEAMYKFIQSNIEYPKYEKEHKIYGKVFVKFLVEETGEITHIEIIRSVEGSINFDAEVIRVIKLMPSWNPGKQGGKPEKVWFTLPIDFSLK